MKKIQGLGVILSIFLVFNAFSAELDMNYVNNFGWGKILASDKAFPAKDNCDMSLFNYSDGKFNITGVQNAQLHLRIMLKDGKSYGFYYDKLKKANAVKYKTRKEDFMRTYVFVSHKDGNEIAKNWPQSLSDIPKWESMGYRETTLDNDVKTWTTSGVKSEDLLVDVSGLRDWIYNAKPGYKIYVYTVCGFIRDATESKYFDKDLWRDMIPIEYVETEPLAAATIEVTASNNPLMAWSYQITAMPEKYDGESLGQATIYKDGIEKKKVNINIKPQGSPNTWNVMVMDVIENTGFYGGFWVVNPTVEGALGSAILQLVERHVGYGDLE